MIGNNSHKSQTTRKRKMKIKQPQMKGIDFCVTKRILFTTWYINDKKMTEKA